MKAKELADILLKNPEKEVYIEVYHAPDFDDGFYSTERISGTEKTPDGIFLHSTPTPITEAPRSPSNKPQIDDISIMMADGEWFLLPEHDCNLSTLRDYAEMGYICNYIGWHENYYVLAELDIDDEYVQREINNHLSTHYLPSDIDYVRILVGLDEDTWKPVYKQFSIEEAIEYAQGK